MNLGIVFADHVNHLCVDDEDDHRILVAKCGMRIGYTHPKNRQASPFGDHVTCLQCLTLDVNVDPDEYEHDMYCKPGDRCRDCRRRGARYVP